MISDSPQLDEFHVFPVHLLPQDPVGIFKAQNSQPQLVLPNSPGVTRLFGGKVVFSAKFYCKVSKVFLVSRSIWNAASCSNVHPGYNT